jgi:hypothetical protein
MSRRDFHLHRLCTCAVDFTVVNQEVLTRGPELLAALLPGGVSSNPNQYFFPRRRRLLSIFTDSGKWLGFRAKAQGADLIGFVVHTSPPATGGGAESGPTKRQRDRIGPAGTRRRRGEGRTLFLGAAMSANARLRFHEERTQPRARVVVRISVQVEGRHQ